MKQLREFAQNKAAFDQAGAKVIGVTTDDLQGAKKAWETGGLKNFPILVDADRTVIRQYGLVHKEGHEGQDIALRTTLLIDANGIERWRRVSKNVADIPKSAEVLEQIRSLK